MGTCFNEPIVREPPFWNLNAMVETFEIEIFLLFGHKEIRSVFEIWDWGYLHTLLQTCITHYKSIVMSVSNMY